MNSNRNYVEGEKRKVRLLALKKLISRAAHNFEVDVPAVIECFDLLIATLSMELQQYRSLDQSFAANFPALENIADIPTSLIEARIVLGWSQGELGERLKLHSQQINRYEQCRYDSIGLSKAIQVGTVLQQELMRRNDWLNRYENQPHESGKNLTPVGLALTEGTVDRGN